MRYRFEDWQKRKNQKKCDCENGHHHCGHSHRREQSLFFRFAFFFGAIPIIFIIILVLVFFSLGQTIRAIELPTSFRVGGMILVFFFIIGFIRMIRGGSRRITSPLSDLMEAADTVAEGDYSVRVRENKHGEFGRLSHSFNNMAQQLEEVSEQRKRLTADIAHELRTPLHILQGNLEGIQDGIYPADENQIKTLLDEIRVLSRLVEDLQTLSLAEGGQLSLRKEDLDVVEFLIDLETSFSGQAEAARIKMILNLSDPFPEHHIQVDIARLQQVCSNLIINAIHHTPADGSVTLSARAIDNGLQIQIIDTGSGIQPDHIPYIFHRFWRADPSRKHEKYAGSGLGLAISKQLIEAHGGKLWVESRPDVETKFTIELYEPPDSRKIR